MNRRVAYSTSLDGFFSPKAVAVVGATDRQPSVGRSVLRSLLGSPFGGTVYPVNLHRESILGVRAYRTVQDIGCAVDLAVIAVPASHVPQALEMCALGGCQSAVIMSAFRETSPEERKAQSDALAIARWHRLKVLGPHSLGLMVPRTGLNATVMPECARPGGVGFVSQSGTMCSAILDWGEQANVGFSVFVSVGDMGGTDWGDVILFLGEDPDTRVVVLCIESVGDPKAFLSAAREVADKKPIIVIKGGRFSPEACAGAPQVNQRSKGDLVLDAALRRSGVLRVDTIEDLFGMAEVLGRQPLPKGRSLAIVSNAGGPAVLATDSLLWGAGRPAKPSANTVEALDRLLPEHWSGGNPVVGLGVQGENCAAAVRALMEDSNVDGALVILTPKPTLDLTDAARRLVEAARSSRVPILASWMGGNSVSEGTRVLAAGGIPCFPFPDGAVRIFNYMWRYRENLSSLYETPEPIEEWRFQENSWVRQALAEQFTRVRAEKRAILTDLECKHVLEAYGIQTLPTAQAQTLDEALLQAERIGYPVRVTPLFRLPAEGRAPRFEMLSALGGYRLGASREFWQVRSAGELRQTLELLERQARGEFGPESFAGFSLQATPEENRCEVILGTEVDPDFGPVVYFGAGGAIGRTLSDVAVGLPPLNRNLALKLVGETRVYEALSAAGVLTERSREELETTLVRFGQLALEQDALGEFWVDTLSVGSDGVRAIAAHGTLVPGTGTSRTAPAIRPYPHEYRKSARLKEGEEVRLRPIRPEDEPDLAGFHARLSDQSVYNRYFSYMHADKRASHERLSRECFSDYDRNLIFVAEPKDTDHSLIGIARLIRVRASNDAEFAVLVEDARQGQGLGRVLVAHLIDVARRESVDSVTGYVLEENRRMVELCKQFGFSATKMRGEEVIRVVLDLRDLAPSDTAGG